MNMAEILGRPSYAACSCKVCGGKRPKLRQPGDPLPTIGDHRGAGLPGIEKAPSLSAMPKPLRRTPRNTAKPSKTEKPLPAKLCPCPCGSGKPFLACHGAKAP
jgi:hypothetical protein